MTQQFLVHAIWDSQAHVWSAYSDDVPGLIAEADTLEALATKLQTLVPELLELNVFPDQTDVFENAVVNVTVTDELKDAAQRQSACLVHTMSIRFNEQVSVIVQEAAAKPGELGYYARIKPGRVPESGE